MNNTVFNSPYLGAQLAVGVFLVITLFLGIWASKSVKNIREYALANRQFGASILTITFMATLIDGFQIQGFPAQIFSDGLIQLVSRFGTVLGFVFFGWFIAPKFMYFKGALTLGDIADQLYGTMGRLVVGVIGTLTSLLSVAIQIIVLGSLGSMLLGIPEQYLVIYGGIILVMYASIGGIRAVTLTDLLQFASLSFFLLFFIGAIINQNGGLVSLFGKVHQLHPEKLLIVENPQFNIKSLKLLTNVFICIMLFKPAFIQRFLMAKDKQEIKKLLFYSAGLRTLFLIAVAIIGFGALLAFPDVSPKNLVPHLANSLFPKSIQPFFAVGIIAIVMSTIDSHLSAGGLTFVHDVIKPVTDALKIRINEFKLVRWLTFFIGSFAIFYAATSGSINLVKSLSSSFHLYDMLGVIIIPIVLGLLGLKTDKTSFTVGVFFSIAILSIKSLYSFDPLTGHLVYLLSVSSSTLAHLVTHYIKNGGLRLRIFDETTDLYSPLVTRLWKPTLEWNQVIETPVSFFSSLRIRSTLSAKNLQGMVLFFLINSFVVSGVGIYANITTFNAFHFFLKASGVILFILLASKPILLKNRASFGLSSRELMLVLMYTIPFSYSISFLLKNPSYLPFEILVGFLFLHLIVDRKTFWTLTIIGIVVAITFSFLTLDNLSIVLSTKGISTFGAYSLGFLVTSTLLDQLREKTENWSRNYNNLKRIDSEVSNGLTWKQYHGTKMDSPALIAHMIQEIIQNDARIDPNKEHAFLVPLNSAFEVLNIKLLHMGSTDYTPMEHRDILTQSLIQKARSLIIVHNHPNNNITPSHEDIRETAYAIRASMTLNMEFIDHIIVTRNSHFSFLTSGNLEQIKLEVQEQEEEHRKKVSKNSFNHHMDIIHQTVAVEERAIEEAILQFYARSHQENEVDKKIRVKEDEVRRNLEALEKQLGTRKTSVKEP